MLFRVFSIKSVYRDMGQTILMITGYVTHELGDEDIGTRVIWLVDGEVMARGVEVLAPFRMEAIIVPTTPDNCTGNARTADRNNHELHLSRNFIG